MTDLESSAFRPRSNPVSFRGDMSAFYGRAAPSVVVIRTRTGHGTGFLVTNPRAGTPGISVLTNNHVVAHGFEYDRDGRPIVAVHRGRIGDDGIMRFAQKPLAAEVVHADARRDLALLRLRADASALTGMRPLEFAEKPPRPGQQCIMIGHPASGMLWTLRDGNVAGVGIMPHDIVDLVMTRLAFSGARKEQLEQQLALRPRVKIAMSSCQGNPGDSGGPLFDDKGRLLAVTFAIPRTTRTDKFVYHIHLDEVRTFLKNQPDPRARRTPAVPNPWESGPNISFKKTSNARKPDILVAGTDKPHQIYFDLDEDTKIASPAGEEAARLLASKKFDWEVAVHYERDRRIVFYDTQNSGACDRVLVDMNLDDRADIQFVRVGAGWKARPGRGLPILSTDYMEWLAGDSAALMNTINKLRILTR